MSAGRSVFFFAVHWVREQAARALIDLGADIDALINEGDEYALTLAGYAVFSSDFTRIALCHRLGASRSAVCRRHAVGDISAVDFSLYMQLPSCLAYLLDNIHVTRPIELSVAEEENCVLQHTPVVLRSHFTGYSRLEVTILSFWRWKGLERSLMAGRVLLMLCWRVRG